MKFLVDAKVLSKLSKPTRPRPNPGVVAWLRAHERELAVEPATLQ